MSKRYFLMNWPNPNFQEGFYVQKHNQNYLLGHLTKRKNTDLRTGTYRNEIEFFQDNTHTISKEAYDLLKKQAIENKKRVTHAYESMPSHEEVVKKLLKL